MATHFKLNDEDEGFLHLPAGAVVVASGVSGTETWIERDTTTTVRIVLQAVAIATAESGALQACIEIEGGVARSEDGPAAVDTHLQVTQSVQVVVKAGERLSFKAYPRPTSARVLRTVIYTADMKPITAASPAPAAPQQPAQPKPA